METLINGWVNNREAIDLRRHRAHYDVIVMLRSMLTPLVPTQSLILYHELCSMNSSIGQWQWIRPGVGVTKPIFSVPLSIEYHAHIWQVLPQLCCGDTCQIWMWLKECNRYFCEIENFAYGEIDERSFSNPTAGQKKTIIIKDGLVVHQQNVFNEMLYPRKKRYADRVWRIQGKLNYLNKWGPKYRKHNGVCYLNERSHFCRDSALNFSHCADRKFAYSNNFYDM